MSSRSLIQVPEGGFGSNLQNPSDAICRIYQPPPGYSFVQCDESGADALIVAYLCRKGKYRALFENGIKPHTFLALHLFQKQLEIKLQLDLKPYIFSPIESLSQVPGWKEVAKKIKDSDGWSPKERYYFIGKKTIHSSSYGMRGPTFQMDVLKESEGEVILTLKEANHYLGFFHELFPEIQEWQVETQTIIRETRTLYNLFGYPRYFNGPLGDKLFKEAYAYVPQSTVAVISNMAFVEMQDWLDHNPEAEWDMLNQKHDSTMAQSPTEEAYFCGALMKTLMERPLVNHRGEHFNMKAEVSIGKNWSKHRDDSNPEGMKEIKL